MFAGHLSLLFRYFLYLADSHVAQTLLGDLRGKNFKRA